MFVRNASLMFVVLAASCSTQAWAQAANPAPPPPPPSTEPKPFISSAELAQLLAKADAARQAGNTFPHTALLRLAPYTANLEYRTAVGPASVHEKEAELFVVLDGSGTLVLGGKLVNESRRDPNNLSGTATEGGTSRTVSKGDMFIVPENVAHWFSSVDGKLAVMTLHIPRSAQ